MPIIATQTREDLRVSIGRILRAVKLVEADAAGSTTTFLTDELATAAATDFNGSWLVFTSGTNDGSIRQVTTSTVASNRVTLTFFPAVAASTADADTAELWDEEYDPEDIHEYIQQAIRDVTKSVFDPVENISLFADGRTARFSLPTTIYRVRDIYIRKTVTSVTIHDCDTDWDEQTVLANVTRTVDTEDRRKGGGSIRFVLAAAAATGVMSSKKISSLDLRKYTHVEGWAKCTVTTAAGDFRILLDDTANVASVLENLQIPVLTADTWAYVRIAMDTPELDSALISVGVRHQVDIGAATFWLDDVKATVNNEADWVMMPRNLWMLDKEARDLIFIDGGVEWAGYGLIKLVGGDRPLLLTTDSQTNEVPDSFVIYQAAGLALLTQPDQTARARMYLGMAAEEKRNLPPLINVRDTI